MAILLLSIGLACVLAAVVGGGLRALRIDFPVLISLKRQVLLGALGTILIVASFAIPSGQRVADRAPWRTSNQPECDRIAPDLQGDCILLAIRTRLS